MIFRYFLLAMAGMVCAAASARAERLTAASPMASIVLTVSDDGGPRQYQSRFGISCDRHLAARAMFADHHGFERDLRSAASTSTSV
jgi:hypothetical protein